jgi:hypothetical protein
LGICIYSSRKFQEPLEAELYGSMRNFDLINTDLSMSGPFTLSIFFTLETKEWGGFLLTEGGKELKDLETYSWPLLKLIWLNGDVITVLYV